MEYFNLRKNDGGMVSCLKEIPDHPETVVIVIHGFSSSKESPTCGKLLERFPREGFGILALDLPGHGTGESAKEILRVPGALDSIEAAERYLLREYPEAEICYFASSFGAYLTGLYISTREHAGRKAFLRSAAVNMPALFLKDNPTEKEKKQLRELEEKGYYDTDMELHRPVRITGPFLEDLRTNNLFEIFDAGWSGEHRIAMAHGREDTVIDPKEAERFASRFGIPITWFPGEGHTLSDHPSTPDRVVDLAIRLFR